MVAAVDIHKIVNSKDVPTPPTVLLHILEVNRNPEAGLSELVDAVSMDPALTAKVIAAANSPMYRRAREVTSLDRAVAQVGVRSVVTLALAFSITRTMPTTGQIGGLRLGVFWVRSVTAAVAAKAVAARVLPELQEEAFFAGLVSDLGRVLLARSASEQYEALVEQAHGWPTNDAEDRSFGVNSRDVTEELLRKWELPELFTNALSAVEASDLSSDEEAQIGCIVQFAVKIAEMFQAGEDSGYVLREVLADANAVGLTGDQADELLDELQEPILELASQLQLEVSETDQAAIVAGARTQLIELTLAADVELRHERDRRESLEAVNRELEQAALRDSLTGLPNRRAFDEILEQQMRLRIRAADSLAKPMGVVMIDVDHFKNVNDTYGHGIGDEVLREMGSVLKAASRTEETIARYGGEEFVMLAPLATSEELAKAAERLRKLVELIEVETEQGILTITASFGCAVMSAPTDMADAEKLMAAADAALYEAKSAGRNCVKISQQDLH
ncbi:MAG: diguanylate cyclase [Acidimicrobiales bacterium]|nr:diguanylate cyclase [Acidimicrobiales bacterium]